MIHEEPGDFEKFLKFSKFTEYDPGPSRGKVYKPLNSRTGFSEVLGKMDSEDIPRVLLTGEDTMGWFRDGTNLGEAFRGAPGPTPTTNRIDPTSRAHILLNWIMAGKP